MKLIKVNNKSMPTRLIYENSIISNDQTRAIKFEFSATYFEDMMFWDGADFSVVIRLMQGFFPNSSEFIAKNMSEWIIEKEEIKACFLYEFKDIPKHKKEEIKYSNVRISSTYSYASMELFKIINDLTTFDEVVLENTIYDTFFEQIIDDYVNSAMNLAFKFF